MRPNTVHVSLDKSHSTPWEVYVYLGGKKIRLSCKSVMLDMTLLHDIFPP
jgi:hypothetical protein